ncbi:hypothetical protein [Demequina sp.]|uniref:hypothetical protein n=1 Tax=Demequina sp. TaxID=2050685 RepID=UPI003D13BC97
MTRRVAGVRPTAGKSASAAAARPGVTTSRWIEAIAFWPLAAVAVLAIPAMWILGAASWDLNTAIAIGQHVRLYDLLEDALPAVLLAMLLSLGLLGALREAREATTFWRRLTRWALAIATGLAAALLGLMTGRFWLFLCTLAVCAGATLVFVAVRRTVTRHEATFGIGAVLVVAGYVGSAFATPAFPTVSVTYPTDSGSRTLAPVQLIAVEDQRAWILRTSSDGRVHVHLLPGPVVSITSCSVIEDTACKGE